MDREVAFQILDTLRKTNKSLDKIKIVMEDQTKDLKTIVKYTDILAKQISDIKDLDATDIIETLSKIESAVKHKK